MIPVGEHAAAGLVPGNRWLERFLRLYFVLVPLRVGEADVPELDAVTRLGRLAGSVSGLSVDVGQVERTVDDLALVAERRRYILRVRVTVPVGADRSLVRTETDEDREIVE